MSIDLNVCTPGQYLRTVHGLLLIYVARRNTGAPFNHEINFADGRGHGTRLDDGRVFEKNRLEGDEDVAEILPVGWEKLHVTKDGVEVKSGQVWRDLDKRMNGREALVVEVANGKALTVPNLRFGCSTKRNRPISISRMHRHSTGWQLVKQANGPTEAAPK